MFGVSPTTAMLQVFGIELFGQRRRAHQVAKHHGELAAFGVGCYPRVRRMVGLDLCRLPSSRWHAQTLTPCRLEDLQAVAGNGNAEVFENVVIKLRQQFDANRAIIERVGVLAKP